MKIYTRTGDKGETGLLGGARVAKDHARIEAYGTVDELNSHLGMLRDLAAPHHAGLIIGLQENLFAIGSRLASNSNEDAARFSVLHPLLPHRGLPELKVIEAMACGVPCITTDAGDCGRLLDAVGHVVPLHDAEALAEAWKVTASLDAATLHQIGELSRRRVLEQFTIAGATKHYADTYARLLKLPQ